MSGGDGGDGARILRRIRRSPWVGPVVVTVFAGGCVAAVTSIHRTEVLDITRVEAGSDDVNLTVVVAHNECSNEPTVRIVGQTPDAVTVRAERRRNFPADSCDDVGALTPFELVHGDPLDDRTIVVTATYGPGECVVDGAPSDRCVVVAP